MACPNSATVAKNGELGNSRLFWGFGNSRRIRQQSPFSATNCRRNRRL